MSAQFGAGRVMIHRQPLIGGQVAGASQAARSWIGYIVGVGATVAILLAAYLGALALLDRAAVLPPPAIVNELCADEKLAWLRDHSVMDPDVLVVGSSIAWRDVDSAQLVRQRPDARPLNGGFCHASVNQTAFVTDYLLGHFPSVRTVVGVFVPQDFEQCGRTRSALFDPRTADAYVFERNWRYRFYVTQFDPVALVRNAILIKTLRDGRNNFDSLEMTRYGDGPLRIVGDRGLVYGGLHGYDPACFAAVRELARFVAASGRRVFLTVGPLNPGWISQFDPSDKLRAALVDGIRTSVDGNSGVRVWDGSSAFAGKPSDFTDAIHINWSAAQRFSALIAGALGGHGPRTSAPTGLVQ